jgi:hypothetical protein
MDMYMNSIHEVTPQPCPEHGETTFQRWPKSATALFLEMDAALTAEGAAWLWMIGTHLDPARRVLWLNDVAIAMRHGLPLNIALALAGHMARVKPLWKRRVG